MKSSNYQNIAHMESRKRNRNLPVIDEDMLREAVGGQSAGGSMLEIAERISAGNEEQPELPAGSQAENAPARLRSDVSETGSGESPDGTVCQRRDALQDLGSGTEDRHGQSVRNRICGKHPPQPSGTLQRGDQPATQGNKQRRSSVERVIQD